MSEASRLTDVPHGTTIYTSFQTAGRGRGKNRTWVAGEGESLLFTVVVNPEKTVHPVVRIPLICALALESTLKRGYGLVSALKWPNDLLVNTKKISGILCEYRNNRILAGIGINIKQHDFPLEIRKKATSLFLEGVDTDQSEVLESFLVSFRDELGNRRWNERAESILYGKDEVVDVLEGGTETPMQKRIRIRGLDDNGFLVIEELESGRTRTIQAGEISFKGFGDFR